MTQIQNLKDAWARAFRCRASHSMIVFQLPLPARQQARKLGMAVWNFGYCYLEFYKCTHTKLLRTIFFNQIV